MRNFTFKANIHARGTIKFRNLVIDESDQFDQFYEQLEELDKSLFYSLATYITLLSEGNKLPKTKCRKLKGLEKCFELKKNHLRMYYTLIDGQGYIICFGSTKNEQKKDIKKLERLRMEIIDQLKNQDS